ncbi:histidine kinase N-terminal 7TM domain-containing protein [Porcipelethomonas sp.]|uniref:histidine kinase N-terminal 7TM domain-containing protein n=1 Tax=Porcipelethomonas sp. TaxID=2981675 RepID=UPI003EF5D791
MTKPNKKAAAANVIITILILIAWLCRIPGLSGSYSNVMGLFRSLIYIGIYIAWGVSVKNRVMQKQVCKYLIAIASLMILWFLIRTIKFHFISDTVQFGIKRYLWYLYYLPMLFIPMFAMLIALSIGKSENYQLPKRTKFLYVPFAVLFILVMTNDLHQLVFTFPKNAAVWGDGDYDYAVGYYLVVALSLLCAVATLSVMYIKCRTPGGHRQIWLPCIPIFIQLVYMVLYNLRIDWLIFLFGDMTAVNCLLYMAVFEICIRCGFIQSNTHYRELFDAAAIGVQITDEEYNVCFSSRKTKQVDTELLRQAKKAPVMLENGLRLSEAPIHGGHVFWTEDMTPLLKVLKELKETKKELEDDNVILEEENAVKTRKARIAEQTRLYNVIQQDTARQIHLMDTLIKQVEKAKSEKNIKHILKQMLVIGAYLKRRSNLVFLSNKTPVLDARELSLTFGESLDNLEMYGVACGFHSELTEPILAVHIMAMYDFFEEIVEHSLDDMNSLTVYAGKIDKVLFLIINTDSACDFSCLASDTVTALRDEDGEWQLTLRLGGEVL